MADIPLLALNGNPLRPAGSTVDLPTDRDPVGEGRLYLTCGTVAARTAAPIPSTLLYSYSERLMNTVGPARRRGLFT